MIVREILKDPEMDFDFFNDFQDTSRWLMGLHLCDAITVPDHDIRRAAEATIVLRRRYKEWEKNFNFAENYGKTGKASRDI